MEKALIFGANGQDGFYVAEECRRRQIEPCAVSRGGEGIRADVADFSVVCSLVKSQQPSHVFHLASPSTTRHEALFDDHASIASGTLHILEAVRLHAPQAKVFIPGSGVQFRNIGQSIRESDPFEASSPYAVARIQSVYAARYFRTKGLSVYVGYLFHHESPRRQSSHVSQMIAQAAQRAGRGEHVTLELGDVSVRKEWTFAGDVVRGIFTLMGQHDVTEAVIGSGEAHSIEEWLEACFCLVGKQWQDHVSLKRNFHAEYPLLVSDPATMRSLGWKPTVSFQQLADMMVHVSP